MNSLILAWASWFLTAFLPAQHTEVIFYEQRFQVSYEGRALRSEPLQLSEAGLSNYATLIAQQDWSATLATLQSKRLEWQLNDWLYYRLVDATVAKFDGRLGDNERRVLEAQLLAASGYDVRLCYDSTQVYVYARTEEALFEVPIITEGKHRFVNLTAALRPRDGITRSLKFHPQIFSEEGRSFSFDLSTLPTLPARLQERVFHFDYRGQRFKVHGASDRTIVAWMSDYPIFSEGKYVETALSTATAERLFEELRPLLKGKTQLEQLELLAAFTRGAFVYKEDKRSYGFSKPMIPDEVLHYPVSDCEDRSALYFALVRDLLNLPVVAIAYNDHLSVAVASNHLNGNGFRYEGRTYYVCDPTGPANSSDIGNHPYGYEHRRFKVVASYVPTRS